MFNSKPITQPEPILTEELSIVAFIFIVIGVLIGLALAVFLVIIPRCKMFKKAGEEWWKGLIPLYCDWIEIKLSGLAWWWFPIYAYLLHLSYNANCYNAVASVGMLLVAFNVNRNLAIKFGKSNGFALVLTFLPFIGYPILGYGKAEYKKDAKVDKNGIFKVEK